MDAPIETSESDPQDETLENAPHDSKNTKKPKKPAMIDDEKVKETLFDEFKRAAHKELMPLLKDEFVQRFKNGAILLHYDIRYRRDIEDMGVEWGEFIDYCFEIGHQLAMDAHIKETLEEKEQKDMQKTIRAGVTMKTVEQMGKEAC